MIYEYQIGGCGVRLDIPVHMREDQFQLFTGRCETEVTVNMQSTSYLEKPPGTDLACEADAVYSEYFQDGAYIRTFHGSGVTMPYAVLEYKSPYYWECRYLEDYVSHFQNVHSCFAHIAFEKILLVQGALILHASLIRWKNEGILFTGRSGIGKSTQASLWAQEAGAEILNGDRTILKKTEGIWQAYGSPYAGSSRIWKNEKAQVKAIVTLEQGRDCSVKRLSGGQAFRCLYAGMTLNTWNPTFMDKAITMISSLGIEIPVYRLTCTPDGRAVKCLMAELQNMDGDVMTCRNNL
jgi:hypothetical protein